MLGGLFEKVFKGKYMIFKECVVSLDILGLLNILKIVFLIVKELREVEL